MQTYSHLILTGALILPISHLSQQNTKRFPRLRPSALLFGSVLPDLPLIILSIITILWDVTTGAFANSDFVTTAGTPPPPELLEASMTAKLFEVWFFENPWVISAQNLFHSPLLVAIFIIIGYAAWRRG